MTAEQQKFYLAEKKYFLQPVEKVGIRTMEQIRVAPETVTAATARQSTAQQAAGTNLEIRLLA